MQPGRALPVKHLYINFGEPGDRRDKDGNLWLQVARRTDGNARGLRMPFEAPCVFYPGGDGSEWGTRFGRRSATDVPAENTDTPFVFNSLSMGLKRYFVPVTSPAYGKGIFTVRLGFSALPNDKPGQRIFDVRLNGKTVLKDFDIVKEAGKPNRAVWKEFTLTLDGSLILDLVARSETPTPEQMPIINGMIILRKNMISPGLEVPGDIWLNAKTPESDVTLRLANFRDKPFAGRLVITAPKGITASLPNGGSVELQPGGRKQIPCRIAMRQGPDVASCQVTLKLVSSAGKVAAERKLTVDWLGEFDRKAVHCGTTIHTNPDGAKALLIQARPSTYLPHIPVSKGAKSPGDRGTSYAYLSFGIPKEIGKIHRARLRLHLARGLWRIRQALFVPPGKTDRPPKSYWGALRRVKGPPWQKELTEKSNGQLNLNKLTYPNRPQMLSESFRLVPVPSNPDIVEAVVPNDITPGAKGQRHVCFAIEPTALNGPVYRSGQGWNADNALRPTLVIDCEPPPKKAKE